MKMFARCHVSMIQRLCIEIALLNSFNSHFILIGIWSKKMMGMKERMREDLSIDPHLYLYKANNVMTAFYPWRYENFMSTATLSGNTLLHFSIPSWRGPQRLGHNCTFFWIEWKLNSKPGQRCRENLVVYWLLDVT